MHLAREKPSLTYIYEETGRLRKLSLLYDVQCVKLYP
jgi:hypothetical protein